MKKSNTRRAWRSWKLEEHGAIFLMELLSRMGQRKLQYCVDEIKTLCFSVFRVGPSWMGKWRGRDQFVGRKSAICLNGLSTPLTLCCRFTLLLTFSFSSLSSSCWNQERHFFFSQEQEQGSLGIIFFRERWCDWRDRSVKGDLNWARVHSANSSWQLRLSLCRNEMIERVYAYVLLNILYCRLFSSDPSFLVFYSFLSSCSTVGHPNESAPHYHFCFHLLFFVHQITTHCKTYNIKKRFVHEATCSFSRPSIEMFECECCYRQKQKCGERRMSLIRTLDSNVKG